MDSNQALLLAVVIPTATVLVGILISNSRINDLGKRINETRDWVNAHFDDLKNRIEKLDHPVIHGLKSQAARDLISSAKFSVSEGGVTISSRTSWPVLIQAA